MPPIDLSFIPPFWGTIVLNAIGAYVGCYAIITVQRLKPALEGNILGTLTFFQCGMFMLVASFALTILFIALGLMAPTPIGIYELLMMGGVISFAFTAAKFADVVWVGLNK